MLSFNDFSLSYGSRPILSNLSFEIASPGLTAIVGVSGCGKSTLLKVMNRLIAPRPRSAGGRNSGWTFVGTASLDSRPLTDWPAQALRRRIGLVLQRPVVFPGSLETNLVGVQRHLDPGVPRTQAIAHAWDCLRLAALAGEVDDLAYPVTALSGGQEQRLCIARALVARPGILCLDEPTSALDPVATAAVEATMQRIARERPVILVTHDVSQARLCERVIFLHRESEAQGAGILVDGPPGAVFDVPVRPAGYLFGHVRQGASVAPAKVDPIPMGRVRVSG